MLMKHTISFWLEAARASFLSVMLMPVLLGTLGAFAWNGVFEPLWFIITLIGAFSAHLFSNMVNDLWDYRNGVDTKAQDTANDVSTNSGMLTGGRVSEETFAFVTWAFLALALLCGVILSIAKGWPLLMLAAVGGLLAYFYVAPPFKFGYRGKGYGEIAILLSFGVLPVMGSYYVQTGFFDVRSFFLSLPIGILTTMVLYNHHFLHWRADRDSGKNTLVVVLGEKKGLLLSKAFTLLAMLTIPLGILVGALPWYALIAVVSAWPLVKAYAALEDTNPSESYGPLMGASIKSTVLCGFFLAAALLLQGIF
ncbi:1,4-dihydroxy-2-naphthoate octaprenyltransferase [Marinococcus luteus]|uniref:1,4-dihydroxy-2-naphthoate octaprenyltransferase n=2 Tax=Marinococcus luteus TaxID=1122204 RepID=A0A1H2V6F6_9BACI|nr:1,4-dihydroxy-2-naphthoate octaprenyltransferase [Marinococcus luteus]